MKGGNHGRVQDTRIRAYAACADVLPRHHAGIRVEEARQVDSPQPGSRGADRGNRLRPPQPLVHASAGEANSRGARRAVAFNIFSYAINGIYHIGKRHLPAWFFQVMILVRNGNAILPQYFRHVVKCFNGFLYRFVVIFS